MYIRDNNESFVLAKTLWHSLLCSVDVGGGGNETLSCYIVGVRSSGI